MLKLVSNKKIALFTLFIIFAIVLGLLNIVIQKTYFEYGPKKVALKNAVKKSLEREKVLNNFLDHSKHSLVFLRNIDSFKNYLLDESFEDSIKNLFLLFANNDLNMMQLRYIDSSGIERIRVDRDKLGDDAYIVKKDELQNKSKRYYFSESKLKEPEKVWFSPIDLNIEHEKIEVPFRPTLRAILPIQVNGKFAGVLIINYFMENFLNELLNAPLYDLIISNKEGYTIKHYDDNNSWGFYKKTKYTIADDFPIEYKQILNSDLLETKTLVSRKVNAPIKDGIYFIFQLNREYLYKENEKLNQQYLAEFIIIIFVSVLLSIVVIRFFSKTLLNLDEMKKLYDKINAASKLAKIGFCEINRIKKEITWSDEMYDIFEIDDKSITITYDLFLSFIAEPYKNDVKKAILSSIQNRSEYFVTYQIITAKNNIKYIEAKGVHYYDEKGNIVKSLGSLYDVSKLKISENKYLQEYQYNFAILNSQVNFILLSNGLNTIDANKAMLTFFGYKTLEEFKNNYECISDRFIEEDGFLQKMSNNQSWIDILKNNQDRYHIVKINNKENKAHIFNVYISENPVAGNAYVITLSDISELYELKNNLEEKVEEQSSKNLQQKILLFEQSKMAALGSMIGNIAHQWKQPLAFISSVTSSIQFSCLLGNEIDTQRLNEDMISIQDRIDYLSDNMTTFRDFLKEKKEYKVVKVQDEIQKALKISDVILRDNMIELIDNIDYQDNIKVQLVTGELVEVIINIINNAKDALKDKFIENPWIKIDVIKKDYYVIISIEDNAGGIPDDILSKIFEQYFTTKADEFGTGLGLYMSKQIVENSLKGKINVQNTKNGAKFSIELLFDDPVVFDFLL